MDRTPWLVSLALAAACLPLLGAGLVRADDVVVPRPAVSYAYPRPVVTYYSPPVVYTPAPTVAYYYTPPTVSYYYAPPVVAYSSTPSVSYYAPPAAVTTTRYGLFGRPRVTTTYYPPVYVRP